MVTIVVLSLAGLCIAVMGNRIVDLENELKDLRGENHNDKQMLDM